MFCERLRELRIERNLTQKDLAKLLNVTNDCIHFWEKGRSEPSIAQLVELASIFNVSLDYLLGTSEY